MDAAAKGGKIFGEALSSRHIGNGQHDNIQNERSLGTNLSQLTGKRNLHKNIDIDGFHSDVIKL